MFDENGNYKEVETIKESDITSNRYTKIGNILQDYIDEDIEEQKMKIQIKKINNLKTKINRIIKKFINIKSFY